MLAVAQCIRPAAVICARHDGALPAEGGNGLKAQRNGEVDVALSRAVRADSAAVYPAVPRIYDKRCFLRQNGRCGLGVVKICRKSRQRDKNGQR